MSTSNGEGLVQIGCLSGQASWSSPKQGYFLFRFPADSLNEEQRRDMNSLRTMSSRVLLQLEGDRPRQSHVIGYEQNRFHSTFHIELERAEVLEEQM